ncbi:hypothetical protein P152DRAFT_455166 [Eremomyces bilateralis CBS 781.70]|uniref:Uncharacterized protein n=1 Tax=Eremomyces bilateralis CBS 781.70 TaxID=1392243 RepID=A0A6G1GBM1_9PEZI|nr:uncharacterized protein P152DRAFT_455166 [Eremomyces bilateralis CBS 781.70]KAF1815453.1 hypothetical protein P152DRAFT_455166 [Eremomyces bilateralis CBS 781.70]
MALQSLVNTFHSLRDSTKDHDDSTVSAYQANKSPLLWRLGDVFLRTWDLGFTAFGGPPVHFQILHRRFVEGHGGKAKWVDEQTVSHQNPNRIPTERRMYWKNRS